MADIDYALRSKVDHLQGLVVQLDHSLSMVGQQVASVSDEQRQARSELATLRTDFLEFVSQARLAANLQRAETRVGVLQDELEHRFGHHKVVRLTAVGILQAFDVGLVTEQTVRAVSEQLMVQTPRYWLAPVLVALAAWAGDDRQLCERAVTEAFRRAPGRTSLFMALLLRRQGRHATAVRWLQHYLNAQDPTALGRDFAVILEAISQGAFGPAGVELVRERLERWREQLLDDDAMQQAQVDRWRFEITRHAGGSASTRFPRLTALSPQWPALDRALTHAETHRAVLDHYSALAAEAHPPMDRVEDAVDDILDRLVREYDTEELPVHRELAFNQAVIAHAGDLDATNRAVAADSASFDETLDYLTIQTTSALNPEAIGVSRSTQRLAVASCHAWFLRAHAAFTLDYRKSLPPAVEVTLEPGHNPAAQALNLPAWTGSFAEPMERLEDSLGEHWREPGEAYVARLGYDRTKNLLIMAAVMVPVLIVFSLCSPIIGIVGGLIGIGVWTFAIMQQAQAGERRQQEAREFVARATQDSINQLRAVGAELTDWGGAFRAADALEPTVRTMIEDLGTIGHTGSPYERRAVAPEPRREQRDREY